MYFEKNLGTRFFDQVSRNLGEVPPETVRLVHQSAAWQRFPCTSQTCTGLVGKGVSSRLGGAWPQLRENGFRSISWRARHDFTGFSCPSSQLVDLKPRFLSRRSMRSTYGHENPVKTFPLVLQLDLRANQSAIPLGGSREATGGEWGHTEKDCRCGSLFLCGPWGNV